MDAFEFNKVAGALLGSLLVVMIIGFVGNAVVPKPHLGHPAYIVEVVEAKSEGPATAAAPAVIDPVTPLLASANVDAGKNIFKQCAACHTADKGGKNLVGPNLFEVVGRKPASHAGFSYSNGMQGFAGKPEVANGWTFEAINTFIANPKADVPGTKMTFAGLKKAEDRANVIAFLRTQADAPKPLP